MNGFANYIKNMDWTVIVDVVVIIVAATLLLMFFKRRNSVKQAVIYMTFLLAYTAVSVVNALSTNSALHITKKIFDILLMFFIVAFVVIYQADLKQIAAKLTRSHDKSKDDYTDEDLRIAASEIVKACQTLSKNNVGALIIVAPTTIPNHILDSGTELDALVSSRLLESLFNTKAPLHDGAVVVKGNRTLSAGCFLSLTQDTTVSKELGTRHRAAIGITEESDVLAIVVSEETGVISVASHGKIKRYMTPDKLYEQLEITYGITYKSQKRG